MSLRLQAMLVALEDLGEKTTNLPLEPSEEDASYFKQRLQEYLALAKDWEKSKAGDNLDKALSGLVSGGMEAVGNTFRIGATYCTYAFLTQVTPLAPAAAATLAATIWGTQKVVSVVGKKLGKQGEGQ